MANWGDSVKAFVRWWRYLGQLVGEGEYLRYCEHVRAKHPEKRIPTEKEFYLARLTDRYARISRCC